MNETEIVEQLLKLNNEQQKTFLRFFSKVKLEDKILIMDGSRKFFYALRDKNKGVQIGLLSYCSHILAIKAYQNEIDSVDQNLINLRAKSFRKPRKKEIVLNKLSLINELKKDKGLSYKQIVVYLKRYHKIEVSESTVFNVYKKFNEKKQDD